MFGKDPQVRFNETLNYIANQNAGLALHLRNNIPQGRVKEISKDLSLGYRSDGEDDPKFNATTSQRLALRSLLLCQRFYFSDLWAGSTEGLEPYRWAHKSFLEPGWRKASLDFWKTASEPQIQQGLAMFYPVAGADRAALSHAAKMGRPGGKIPTLTMWRSSAFLPGDGTTCYQAVRAWLLKSGIVSLRWYMKDVVPTMKASLTTIFGEGNEVWAANLPFTRASNLPGIPEGYIVHMYDAGMQQRWNGHWMVSLGGGLACGCNNGEIESDAYAGGVLVAKPYTKTGSLKGQFLGFNEELKRVIPDTEPPQWGPFVPPKYEQGRMVVFDPMLLPNRL